MLIDLLHASRRKHFSYTYFDYRFTLPINKFSGNCNNNKFLSSEVRQIDSNLLTYFEKFVVRVSKHWVDQKL